MNIFCLVTDFEHYDDSYLRLDAKKKKLFFVNSHPRTEDEFEQHLRQARETCKKLYASSDKEGWALESRVIAHLREDFGYRLLECAQGVSVRYMPKIATEDFDHYTAVELGEPSPMPALDENELYPIAEGQTLREEASLEHFETFDPFN